MVFCDINHFLLCRFLANQIVWFGQFTPLSQLDTAAIIPGIAQIFSVWQETTHPFSNTLFQFRYNIHCSTQILNVCLDEFVYIYTLYKVVAVRSRYRMFLHQAPPSIGFSRQEYWSGFPFPSPGDLADPGIEPRSPHCRQALYRLSHPVELSANPCPTPLLSCSPSFSLTAGIPLTHLGERRHWLFGIQAFGLRLVLRLPAQACFLGLSPEELEMMSNMAVHLRILFL